LTLVFFKGLTYPLKQVKICQQLQIINQDKHGITHNHTFV